MATAGRRSLDSGEGYGRSALGGAAGDPVGSGAIRPVFGHRFPIEVDAVTSLRTVGHMVQTYTDTFEAIEAAVADARELPRIDRRVLVDERLDDEEREHLRRRIGFYLSDMHLRLRPDPEILPLNDEDPRVAPRRRPGYCRSSSHAAALQEPLLAASVIRLPRSSTASSAIRASRSRTPRRS